MAQLGKWGQMRLEFLREFQPTLLRNLKRDGTLRDHLLSVDEIAKGMMRSQVAYGVNGLLAEETIRKELIMPEPAEMTPAEPSPQDDLLEALARVDRVLSEYRGGRMEE